MKIKSVILLCILFLPAFAYAADDSGSWYDFILDFFNWIGGVIADFVSTFLEGISATIHRALAYFIEWAVIVKLYLYLGSLEMAYGIAGEIANDLNLFGYLTEAIALLPPDVKYAMNFWGLPNALNIIIQALLTRFVMDFMGW